MARYNGQKNRRGLWIALTAFVVVVLGAAIWWYPAQYNADPPVRSTSDSWHSPSTSAGGETDGGGGGVPSESASAEASGEPSDAPDSDAPGSDAPSAGTVDKTSDGTTKVGPGNNSASESPASGGEQAPASSPSDRGSGAGGGTTTPDKPASSGNSAKEQQQQIDRKYESRIVALRSECVGKSQSLLDGMLAEIKGNEDATAELLQGEFLDDLIAAEQSCDSSFQSLVSGAKSEYEKAGLDTALLPNWSAQYEAEKSAARVDAIGKLASALQ